MTMVAKRASCLPCLPCLPNVCQMFAKCLPHVWNIGESEDDGVTTLQESRSYGSENGHFEKNRAASPSLSGRYGFSLVSICAFSLILLPDYVKP